MKNLILRLDDASPLMNIQKWKQIENIIDKHNIKPFVAVIPNHQEDKKRQISDNEFWDIVKSWYSKGWHIALHGYNHVYLTQNKGLVSSNKRSEFAGVELDTQTKKIKDGIKIFRDNGINPKIWIAPAHTFDKNTLKALKQESDIEIVSDGYGKYPFNRYGFFWLPQQIIKLEKQNGGGDLDFVLSPKWHG